MAIFCSAFLLFQVQPMISKFILPWFGGSPAVWTTAMLFFQCVLCAGYVYAHVLTRIHSRQWQAGIHIALLLLGALLASCRIPDDCIDSKRYPLFMAREVMRQLIDNLCVATAVHPGALS
jgi:hypothetical protein